MQEDRAFDIVRTSLRNGRLPHAYVLVAPPRGAGGAFARRVCSLLLCERGPAAAPCGECDDCKKGHYNLCQNIRMLAIPHERDGVNAEYCVHKASMCYKLPDNMDTMEGALIEPLSVGFHATELADARPGETAIVLGSGCIGRCRARAHGGTGLGRQHGKCRNELIAALAKLALAKTNASPRFAS